MKSIGKVSHSADFRMLTPEIGYQYLKMSPKFMSPTSIINSDNVLEKAFSNPNKWFDDTRPIIVRKGKKSKTPS